MGSGWWIGLALMGVMSACAGAAQAQEARLWAVDCLTKVLRDALSPSASGPVRLEGARGETLSGQMPGTFTRRWLSSKAGFCRLCWAICWSRRWI